MMYVLYVRKYKIPATKGITGNICLSLRPVAEVSASNINTNSTISTSKRDTHN